MRLRRWGSWLGVVGIATCALVVTRDAPIQASPRGPAVGSVRPVAGGVVGLSALPSAAPAAGSEAGGGGLAGPVWGLFGNPADDSGVLRAVGVQVDLGAPGWGAGAVYTVLDAGTTTQVWPASGSSTTSVVPAGILQNGGAYELEVTAGGVTTRRPFTVDASRGSSVSGAMTAQVSSIPVSVNTGQKMALGLSFASADVGVTAGTGAIGRSNVGLPAGWSWSGVGADVWKVQVVPGSPSLPGVDRIVNVYGTGVLLLGCQDQADGSSVCDVADGQLVGEGPRAVVDADGRVVLTEQSTGQTLSFDPHGRVVGVAQPGGPPVVISYTTAGGLDTVTWEVGSSPLTWQVFYPGDDRCDDSALPTGFVITPVDHVCGWADPMGRLTRVQYSQPSGATVPRISRIVQLPDCAASMVDCDPNLTVFADYGWDARNRLAVARDTLTARAVLAGLIDAGDTTHWQTTSYDSLGRVSSTRTPSPVTDDRGRLQAAANVVTTQSRYASAAAWAPATQQVAVTTTGAGSALTTTTAADDGGRLIATQAPVADAVATRVWAPYDDLLLATIRANGQAETAVFDKWFRRISKHIGPLDAFGAACAPDSPDRGSTDATTGNWTACAPITGTTQATSQVITFDDQALVGKGLTGSVFAPAAAGGPSPFAGAPTTHVAADQQPESGIPVAEVMGAGAVTGAGLRLDGGLLIQDDTDPIDQWSLQIVAPPDLISSGVVVVDGQFCAVLQQGEGSCAVTPDDRARHLTIDVVLARAPTAADRLTLQVQDPDGDPATVNDDNYKRRWSADTALTNHDPVPAGTIADWDPTTVTQQAYGCGAATASAQEQAACIGSATTAVDDPGGHAITRNYRYAVDAYGGVRLAAASRPDGEGETTYETWGVDDTPAGLPNADQLGGLVTVPQRGLPKTVTMPGGRTTTTVHDAYGTPVCQQIDGGNWTCATLDATRRPVVHTIRSNQAGVAPFTISTDYAPAGNPLINRTSRTSEGGATVTDQTVLDPTGRVLEYTDTLDTTTDYTYDGMGRMVTTTITPAATPGQRPRPLPRAATSAFTYAVQFDASTGQQTGMTFQGRPLFTIAYDDPEHGWLPTGYTYDLTGGTVALQLDYDSDLNPFGRTWTFADGTKLLDCATTAVAPTACTAAVGDSQPGTTASGRLLANTVDGNFHRFTFDTARRLTGAQIGATSYGYTWDDDNNLTGRAVTGTATASYTYTFNDADQLTATTDPLATIGGFDDDANHARIGPDAYTYDALRQLSSTTDTTTGATTSYERDARRRITTRTSDPGGTYHLSYSLPDDQRPTLAVDGDGVATPLLSLPGGLLFRGAGQGPVVSDMQGNAILTLTADGRRPATPIQQYEPFGQPTPDTELTVPAAGPDFGWQQSQSDGSLVDLGARSLNTRLGIFLQPDPQPHGSQAGPYSYTDADPVNQSDPTGMCTGWACVKEASDYLQPIADAATLIACAFSFGVACLLTSLARIAISALNFAADFPLHQDASADGVTLGMAVLNLVAAIPLAYEASRILPIAQKMEATTEGLEAAISTRASELDRGMSATSSYLRRIGVSSSVVNATIYPDNTMIADITDLAVGATRARQFLAFSSVFTTAIEYGSSITSKNLFNCCWKLW